MLILYRKSGQGIEVKHAKNGKAFDVDFMFNSYGFNHFRVNGKETKFPEKDSFYIDNEHEVLMAIVEVTLDGSIRVGIDAPYTYNIRRKERPEKIDPKRYM